MNYIVDMWYVNKHYFSGELLGGFEFCVAIQWHNVLMKQNCETILKSNDKTFPLTNSRLPTGEAMVKWLAVYISIFYKF